MFAQKSRFVIVTTALTVFSLHAQPLVAGLAKSDNTNTQSVKWIESKKNAGDPMFVFQVQLPKPKKTDSTTHIQLPPEGTPVEKIPLPPAVEAKLKHVISKLPKEYRTSEVVAALREVEQSKLSKMYDRLRNISDKKQNVSIARSPIIDRHDTIPESYDTVYGAPRFETEEEEAARLKKKK